MSNIKPVVMDTIAGFLRNVNTTDILGLTGIDNNSYPIITTLPQLNVVNGGSALPTTSGYYLMAVAPTAGYPTGVVGGSIALLSSSSSSVWTQILTLAQIPDITIDVSGNTWVKNLTGDGWVVNKQLIDTLTTNSNIWSASQVSTYVTQQLLNTPSLAAVNFATTTNDTLTGLAARDGVTPVAGMVALVKNQTTNDNGFWIVSATAWTRAYYDTSTDAFAPITTQTTYSQLNIQGGVVNVLAGTANKHLQFQISIITPSAVFGSTTVYVTQTTKIPVAGSNCKVVDNTTGNSSFNGSWAFPYATPSYALTSGTMSFPATIMIPASGSAFSDALTFTSEYSYLAIETVDSSTTAGKSSFSGVQTYATGNTSIGFKGTTHSTGVSVPFVFQTGNLYCHWFENVAITTSSTSLMSIGSDASNFITFRNVDATGSAAATLPLPSFTNPFTINFYNQNSRFPISGTGAANTVINIFNTDEYNVRVYPTYLGSINWQGKTFGLPVGSTALPAGLITSQTQLNTIMAWTTDVTYDGYYAISGFTPTTGTFAAGAIFGKQTAAGVATEVFWARTFAQAPGTLNNAIGGVIYKAGSNTWSTTVPLSQLPGGLVKVYSQTFSSVGSISIQNVFTSTYANYKMFLLYKMTGASGAFTNALNLSVAGTPNTTANYNVSGSYYGPFTGSPNATAQTSFNSLFGHSGATDWNRIDADFINPQASDFTIYMGKARYTYAGAFYTADFGSHFNLTTQFDGFTFTASSGDFSSIQVIIYGYN